MVLGADEGSFPGGVPLAWLLISFVPRVLGPGFELRRPSVLENNHDPSSQVSHDPCVLMLDLLIVRKLNILRRKPPHTLFMPL